MLKLVALIFSVLAFSLVDPHLGRGQPNADGLWSGWQLGSLRGSVILRISDEERASFVKFVDDFASERAFSKFPSVGKPSLSGREFISSWYRRPDGVTIFVTNITMSVKMQVAFYNKIDGEGTAEAERTFFEFKALSSMFSTYE